ncbi:MAG: PrgI family protein [Patescibacteria group bacterium]|nr:PrgI family protein [Patescibacteria group bacterium]MDE2590161.1 PrgI family protein [Patescibacteria group bacterium]
MRTTVIPAQITTVEDKIAGNLSMTQVVILMIPVFFGTLIFALFPPTMHVAVYKLPPVLVVLLLSLLLSLRIKGKVVANWLHVLLSYNLRPRFYVFNKNDAYLRDIPERLEQSKKQKPKRVKKDMLLPAKSFSVKELKQIEAFIKNPQYSLSLKPGKKGELYVAISEIE